MSEHCQVVVIGGGPAGMAAAIAAAEAGANTLLLDEQDDLGGQLRYRRGDFTGIDGAPLSAPDLAATLSHRARAAGVRIELRGPVWAVFPNLQVGVRARTGSRTVQADRIVLANGSIDRTAVFPGGSLPGVFTARAVQILINAHRVLPGARFAIVGEGREADEVAGDILAAGGAVAFVTASADGLTAGGVDGVVWVECDGARELVDIIVVAAGRQPDVALAQMAEIRLGFDANAGRFAPALSRTLESSVSGLYVAGDAAAPGTIEASIADGWIAGLEAARSLGITVSESSLTAARERHAAVAPGRMSALTRVLPAFNQVDHGGMERHS